MKVYFYAGLVVIVAIALTAVVFGLIAALLGHSFFLYAAETFGLMAIGVAYSVGALQAMRDRKELQRQRPSQQSGAAGGFDDWLAEQDRRHGL